MQFGIADPKRWLDDQTDENLALWQGYFEVEPFASDWERHSILMAKLDELLMVSINSNISDDSKRYESKGPKAFLPSGFYADERASIASQLSVAARALATPGTRVVYGDDD